MAGNDNAASSERRSSSNTQYLINTPTVSWMQVGLRAAGTVQTRNRYSDKGRLKEQAGFLVNKSLTFPFTPP